MSQNIVMQHWTQTRRGPSWHKWGSRGVDQAFTTQGRVSHCVPRVVGGGLGRGYNNHWWQDTQHSDLGYSANDNTLSRDFKHLYTININTKVLGTTSRKTTIMWSKTTCTNKELNANTVYIHNAILGECRTLWGDRAWASMMQHIYISNLTPLIT